MDKLVQFVCNPFAFNWDFDRSKREEYYHYGEYKPSPLKRLMMWVMNEKVDPVDWEEVPPFYEAENEFTLKKSRPVQHIPIYECCTQPNMLTQKDIYVRRLILAGVFLGMYKMFDKKQYFLINTYGFGSFYYKRFATKVLMLGWFYYMICRIYVHKDYQLPYN